MTIDPVGQIEYRRNGVPFAPDARDEWHSKTQLMPKAAEVDGKLFFGWSKSHSAGNTDVPSEYENSRCQAKI